MVNREKRELLIKLMKNKTYLYEVHSKLVNGVYECIGYVCADNDHEAKEFALVCFPQANFVRKDHWGKGPMLEVK